MTDYSKKSIVSTCEFKNADKPIEKATRYYISSLDENVFQKAIPSHWAIENKLHWTLDVASSEDAPRKRTKNAVQNFSTLTKIALNVLKKNTKAKVDIKSRKLNAAMNNQFMMRLPCSNYLQACFED